MTATITPPTIRTCSEPDCDRTHKAHGLCQRHYQRLQKSGPRRPVVDIDEVLFLIEGGRPIPSICDALDRHPDTITLALRRAGHEAAAQLFVRESSIRKQAKA